jgi:hypothetical protein
MATIILSVGMNADGDLRNLYTGPSMAAAEAAMVEAGRQGRICEGWVFNNPEAAVHQYYTLKSREERKEERDRRVKAFA